MSGACTCGRSTLTLRSQAQLLLWSSDVYEFGSRWLSGRKQCRNEGDTQYGCDQRMLGPNPLNMGAVMGAVTSLNMGAVTGV